MKNLVIVESPAKSKTIEKYLGKDYKVLSSKGHVRDLAIKGKAGLGVDLEHDFKPTYVLAKDKEAIVKELKTAAKKADRVYLATDPDREGEAISWHLAELLGLDLTAQNRIVFNEITKQAILKALANPRSIDMGLVKSQETRRILDRIIGFKLSGLLQNKIKSKSAGRVQSIALRLICDREKEVAAFKAEAYWRIKADFCLEKIKFSAELTKIGADNVQTAKGTSIKDRESATELVKRSPKPFILSDLKKAVKQRAAYLPFITSTLQQEASNKLGFNAKKTMMLAQRLYEGVDIGEETKGLISYMRTDSTRLSQEFISAAFAYITTNYGAEYKGFYRQKNDANAQDAHEAIRPTALTNTPEAVKEYLTNDEFKLYKLIYCRALASLMAPAKYETTSYLFKVNDLTYAASGKVALFPGFLQVYREYDQSKDSELPVLIQGEAYAYEKIAATEHFTEAPKRYTEAELIKTLEEEGVGRPSTYATIIDTITKREYVEFLKTDEKKKTKYFIPTAQGILTDEKLKEYFLSVINVKYTSQMEKELDEIALNKRDHVAALKDFYDRFAPLIAEAYAKMEKKEAEKTGEFCPECGAPLVYRHGRYGDFIACSDYPKCKYIQKKPKEVEAVGRNCPECGAALVYRHGRYGEFIACSNYPTCKYTEFPAKKKEEAQPIGRKCPECGAELVKRKSRFGTYFIGCANYPHCRYVEKLPSEDKKQ